MRKTAKYKMKLAWILIAALCVGMTPVSGMDSVKTVKAEETVQSDRQVTLDKGILKIEGIAIVTSETVADIDLQEVQKIEFGTGVKRISAGVFQNCKNLTEITWGEVTSIGNHAFAGCENLDVMILPGSVENIGEGAFWGCSKIEFIVLLAVNKIGKNAFPLETSIVWENVGMLPETDDDFWQERTGTMFIVGVTAWDSVIEQNSQESITWNKRDSNSEQIFYSCQTKDAVTVKEYCASLTENHVSRWEADGKVTVEIVVPGDEWWGVSGISISSEIPKTSVKRLILKGKKLELGGQFNEYLNLQSVKISGTVKIREECFSGCNVLESFEAEKFTSIGKKAFYGCTSLKKISIYNGIDSLGESAFEGCTNLAEVVIEKKIVKIAKRVFYGCEKLESVELPECVRKIRREAFGNCSSLKSIVLPENVSSIGLGNFTTTDIYWKGNEVTLPTPGEGESEFFEQVTGTMFIPAGSVFWQQQKERYPDVHWQEWTPEIKQVETETCDLFEQWAFRDDSNTIQVEPWLDEEGMPCIKIAFNKKYQRVAFQLPEKIRAQDYAAVSIRARVGGQLMFELSTDNIETAEIGAYGENVVDCTYPFWYEGEEGETKYGTEEVDLINDTGKMASYMVIGTCRGPDDVEPYGRKYEFYIYSVTFHPISSDIKELAFESRQIPENSQAPTIETGDTDNSPSTTKPTEPPIVTSSEGQRIPSAVPEKTSLPSSEKPVESMKPAKRQKSIVRRPTISLQKKGRGKQHYIQVTIKSSVGRYFDLYMKKKGKKYVRIRLKKTAFKKGKRVVKLKYTKKGYTVCFKARTYNKRKGKKRYGAYSREKRIKL